MEPDFALTVTLPPEQLEALARRVADLLWALVLRNFVGAELDSDGYATPVVRPAGQQSSTAHARKGDSP